MDDILLDPSIPRKMFYKIGEVGRILGVKSYVLRYWESEFKQVKPSKNRFGQRVYRQKDLAVLLMVRDLLYKKKFTIAGAKRQLEADRVSQRDSIHHNMEARTEQASEDEKMYLHLLREHKDQLEEILNIFKSQQDIQSDRKVGA